MLEFKQFEGYTIFKNGGFIFHNSHVAWNAKSLANASLDDGKADIYSSLFKDWCEVTGHDPKGSNALMIYSTAFLARLCQGLMNYYGCGGT